MGQQVRLGGRNGAECSGMTDRSSDPSVLVDARCHACGACGRVRDRAVFLPCGQATVGEVFRCCACNAAVVVPPDHVSGAVAGPLALAEWSAMKQMWEEWTQRDAFLADPGSERASASLSEAASHSLRNRPSPPDELAKLRYRIVYWDIGQQELEGLASQALRTLLGRSDDFVEVRRLVEGTVASPPRSEEAVRNANVLIARAVWTFVSWLGPKVVANEQLRESLLVRWPIAPSELDHVASLAAASTRDTWVTPPFAAAAVSIILGTPITPADDFDLVEFWRQLLHQLFEELVDGFEATAY